MAHTRARCIDPRIEALIPAAERKRRQEVASRELLGRRAREHRDELDVEITA